MYLSDLGPGAAVTFAHYCVWTGAHCTCIGPQHPLLSMPMPCSGNRRRDQAGGKRKLGSCRERESGELEITHAAEKGGTYAPPSSLSLSLSACLLPCPSVPLCCCVKAVLFATVVDRRTVVFLLLDKLSLVISSSFSVWSLGFRRI